MTHYDVLIIGSGFGGSVSALRLTEKGYRVGVIEAGRRFADADFPKSSWHVRDYLFAPAAGCHGIFRVTPLRDVLVLTGAGVGGGSLGYANTLYQPPPGVYADPQWAHITDWQAELAPYYDQARRMLGVATYPGTSPADRVMRDVADEMGIGATYRNADVGVFFGAPGTRPGTDVADPYFGGAGPTRRSCTHCGECMTGCRHNAKNTLVKNYLYLAEQAGAEVHPSTTVHGVTPRRSSGYEVRTHRTGRRPTGRRAQARTFTADQVIFAAGALGTAKLLHALREDGSLPNISSGVGRLTRTNSEAILAARARGHDVDYSRGVAITSSIHPDPVTHVEPVRYGRGSNLLALLGTVLVDGDQPIARWRVGLREMRKRLRELPAMHNPRHWSEQTIVLLVMQSLDNSITTSLKRRRFGRRRLTSRPGAGEPNPTWIPAGHEVTRRVAEHIDGVAGGTWGDLVDVPVTGHLIGGCVIGDSPSTGVVDAYHRLFGHDDLHVLDGSTVSVNLGVNPSLTITAQAERAMSMWPNRGEADARPPLGAGYERIAPVAPQRPVVPEAAPGALRLPLITEAS
ncbi:MAG TPA: GMC family oxidoreductase [Jatrophihabitans sp.]|jgi:cholesterol oxidase|uniref:GMC family oxidoreductase n=1 Tax=Jatrophihabitans sp. TaxID=1932789 RepID=UPI002E0473CC|nr:GMC family oxidoreductase [Jatrophihabitans sp.]